MYNSAWIGSAVAVLSSALLSLPAFYLVKNAIWTPEIIFGRLMWFGAAIGLSLIASLFFRRFDPASEKPKRTRGVPVVQLPEPDTAQPVASVVPIHLTEAWRRYAFVIVWAAGNGSDP